MAMNYCPDCGYKLPQAIDNRGTKPKFCPDCGNTLALINANVRRQRTAIPATGLLLGALIGAHHANDAGYGDASLYPDAYADYSGMGDMGGFGDFGGFDGGF